MCLVSRKIPSGGQAGFLIPEGLQPVARGRGATATTTPGFELFFTWHPARCAGSVGITTTSRSFRDPGRGPIASDRKPGLVAIARPRAILCDPSRDHERCIVDKICEFSQNPPPPYPTI